MTLWLHPDSHVGMEHRKMSERVSVVFTQREPAWWTPDGIGTRRTAEEWWRRRVFAWVKAQIAAGRSPWI